MDMHSKMAAALDQAMDEIKAIQKNARENDDLTRPKWPMIVLRTPKGWTGPKVVDGNQIEGSFTSGSDHDGQTGTSSDVKRLAVKLSSGGAV